MKKLSDFVREAFDENSLSRESKPLGDKLIEEALSLFNSLSDVEKQVFLSKIENKRSKTTPVAVNERLAPVVKKKARSSDFLTDLMFNLVNIRK